MDGCLKVLGLSRHYLYQPVAMLGNKARMDLWDLRTKPSTSTNMFGMDASEVIRIECCRRKCLVEDRYVHTSRMTLNHTNLCKNG